MIRRPIGIFDSGEGGLTVMREIARLLPGEDLVYACDTAHFPYGPRPQAEVRRFFLSSLKFFQSHDCKLVVVACNTVTASIMDLLEGEALPVPTVGVVKPGARAAAAISRTGRIGVAATEGTCASGVYPVLIRQDRPDAVVVQWPCPIMVTRAEEGRVSGPAVRAEVEQCLKPLLAAGVDTLVLGCTHFPHMRAVIEEVIGPEVALVDPGEATAREVAARLAMAGQVNTGDSGRRSFFTTGDPDRFTAVASRLWPGGVARAHQIQLDLEQE